MHSFFTIAYEKHMSICLKRNCGKVKKKGLKIENGYLGLSFY